MDEGGVETEGTVVEGDGEWDDTECIGDGPSLPADGPLASVGGLGPMKGLCSFSDRSSDGCRDMRPLVGSVGGVSTLALELMLDLVELDNCPASVALAYGTR